MKDDCPFCDYAGPSEVLHDFGDAFVIEPLRQVTPGHLLVVPKIHVPDFAADPEAFGVVAARAAEFWSQSTLPTTAANLITSRGREATQTVLHLHLHLVPRAEHDGLKLPWANPNAGEWKPRCERCDRTVEGTSELRYGHCIGCLAEPGVLQLASSARVMEDPNGS